MTIRAKIIIWFSVLGIIPTMLIGMYYSQKSERSVQEKVLDMSLSAVGQTAAAANDRISYIEKSLNTAMQNDDILGRLDDLQRQNAVDRGLNERKIANYFNTVAFNHPYIKTIILIPNSSTLKTYGEGTALDHMSKSVRYFVDEEYKDDSWFLDISSKRGEMKWHLLEFNGEKRVCLVKNFSFFAFARPMGVVVLMMDETAFGGYESLPEGGTSLLLLSENGLSVKTGQAPPVQFTGYAQDLTPQLTETSDEFIIDTKLGNGWHYANIIPKSYLFADIRSMRNNAILFVLFTTVLFVLLAVLTSWNIGHRIERLVAKFKRLETGDFTVDKTLGGNDELAALEDGYSKTVLQLSKVIDQNYVYKLEKRDAQLAMLQYQINPHFLYNVLELINSMAAAYGAKDIREVTQCLGRMYRYNTSKSTGQPTLLRDEIEHIKNYIYLNNVQMSGRLMLYCDIEPDIFACRILRFTLQPVVENCIRHAFEGKGGMCCIEINAKICNGILQILVQDDGVGIKPQRLAQVRDEMRTHDNGHEESVLGIGLRNVHARIRLKHGEPYGLQIDAAPDAGTVVTIRLPAEF